MLKLGPVGESDKKRILYLISFLLVVGYIIDIAFANLSQTVVVFNIISILLVAISLTLQFYSLISISRSIWIIIYSLILNILLSHCVDIDRFTDLNTLRTTIIILAFLSVTAFLIGKKHALIIGSILTAFLVVLTITTSSNYLSQNIFILLLVVGGYSLGIYYLIYSLEERTRSEKHLLTELKTINKDTNFLNSLAFELTEYSGENDIVSLMLKKIKEHTEARFAVFNVYDPEQKLLIVRSIEASGPLLNTAMSIIGGEIINTTSPVSNDVYNRVHNEQVGFSNSLTEVSFGRIPESIDKAFRRITGISCFYGIAHFFSGKLYGTTLLGFKSSQTLPKHEFLKSYAHLAAISLRRNTAEKALLQNEAKLRSITTNISDVVFTTDMNLNTTYVSPSVVKLTGESPEDYISKKIEKRYTLSSLKKIKSVFAEEIELENNPAIDKNRTRIIELELIKPNGDKIHVATHLTFIRDENGKPAGIQGVTRNISDIKKTHKQLEDYTKELKSLNADKDRFMQILAHDLKNPFNVILGLSEILVKNFDHYKRDVIVDFLKEINQTTRVTYNLLEELLLWSSAQSGKLKYEPEMLNFSKIGEEIIAELTPNANKKNISIQFSPEQEYSLFADKSMIKTTLRNLISNAIKFSRNGDDIKLNFEKNSKELLVVVADHGVGIKPEDISKLWDFSKPFTTDGTEKEKGTGLGLLLCKEFVEKHGGKIWVESKADIGTIFKFTIPIINRN